MPMYHIEMGQGLIDTGSDSHNFHIRTSTLFSCSLITGFNAQTGRGGAFHYPAGALSDPEQTETVAAMKSWMTELNPGEVKLIFAKRDESLPLSLLGTSEPDKKALETWVTNNSHARVTTELATAAGMQVVNGQFNAGNVRDLDGPQKRLTDLSQLAAAKYNFKGRSDFTLVGRNGYLTADPSSYATVLPKGISKIGEVDLPGPGAAIASSSQQRPETSALSSLETQTQRQPPLVPPNRLAQSSSGPTSSVFRQGQPPPPQRNPNRQPQPPKPPTSPSTEQKPELKRMFR
jgi:hypothetical protein